MDDELRTLRELVDALERRVEQLETLDVTGTVGFLATTSHLRAYPTSANAWYWVIPKPVVGSETEGGGASFGSALPGLLAYGLGTVKPAEGTTVEIGFDGSKFFFIWNG